MLWSRGGGAHASAATALERLLGGEFEVQRINPLEHAWAPVDPLARLSRGRYGGEDAYNFLMRGGLHRTATWLCDRYGAPTLRRRAAEFAELLRPHLRAARPDLVVSVVPLINGIGLTLAEELGVPYVVLPVDLDTSNYINGLRAPTYGALRFALPFSDPELRTYLEPAEIPSERFRVTGFPVRPAFLERRPKPVLRAALGLPRDRAVVMLMMGANGGRALARYARALFDVGRPVHFVLCAGRNATLARALERLRMPAHVSRTVLPFTDDLAAWLGASDVLVTKPGPASICEALYLEVPMLLDCSTPLLRWERFNVSLVERYGVGARVGQPDEATPIIARWLGDADAAAALRERMAAFPKPHFGRAFTAMLRELMGQPDESAATEPARLRPSP